MRQDKAKPVVADKPQAAQLACGNGDSHKLSLRTPDAQGGQSEARRGTCVTQSNSLRTYEKDVPMNFNGRCCVFQPFDKGAHDKRYEDTLVPAIKAAELESYRVDRPCFLGCSLCKPGKIPTLVVGKHSSHTTCWKLVKTGY